MTAHPVRFGRRDGPAAEPCVSIGGVTRAEFSFAGDESYLIHGFPDGGGVRLAFTALDGRHGLVSDPADPGEAERFAALVDEFSGWHFVELTGEGQTLSLCCDGHLDLTGRAARTIALMSSGRLEAALAAAGDLLRASPRLKFARILRYAILAGLGEEARALETVREEIALYREEFVALRLLGDRHYADGELERARVFYAQAARVSPYNEELLRRLAEIALAGGKAEDARRLVPRLVSIRPGSEEYLALLEETKRLHAGAGEPFSLEGSPDHVDPATATFFTRTERLFRKSAFREVCRLIRAERDGAADPVRRRKIGAWAAEVLANLPERLPPFTPAPELAEAEELVAACALEGGADEAAHAARFLDAAGERHLFTLEAGGLERHRALLARLAALHPDRAEVACARARSLVRESGRAALRGTGHRERLAELRALLSADPCSAVSSYAAVTQIAQLIDRAVDGVPCGAERADALVDLWDGLLGILAAHPNFANYAPLFLLLRKWKEGTGGVARTALRMADRFCAFAAGPLDPDTVAVIGRAARAARFDLAPAGPDPPAGPPPDQPVTAL